MNIIRKLRASIRLNEAVVQADKAHEETGERYYVIKMEAAHYLN